MFDHWYILLPFYICIFSKKISAKLIHLIHRIKARYAPFWYKAFGTFFTSIRAQNEHVFPLLLANYLVWTNYCRSLWIPWNSISGNLLLIWLLSFFNKMCNNQGRSQSQSSELILNLKINFSILHESEEQNKYKILKTKRLNIWFYLKKSVFRIHYEMDPWRIFLFKT